MSDEGHLMSDSEVDRFNRAIRDLFWLRHSRSPDFEDPEDVERWKWIERWLMQGARLPGELPMEAEERCARQRALRSVLPSLEEDQ